MWCTDREFDCEFGEFEIFKIASVAPEILIFFVCRPMGKKQSAVETVKNFHLPNALSHSKFGDLMQFFTLIPKMSRSFQSDHSLPNGNFFSYRTLLENKRKLKKMILWLASMISSLMEKFVSSQGIICFMFQISSLLICLVAWPFWHTIYRTSHPVLGQ